MNGHATLSARGLHLSYGANQVLQSIDLEVKTGEVVGLVGPNGVGKTTFLRIVSGVLKPQRGVVYLGGDNLGTLRPKDRAARVAMVPQAPSAPQGFTALEVVLMGRNPHLGLLQWEGIRDLEVCRRAMALTSTWGFSQRLVSSLSGGEKQRVFIARALAQEASILLLDEPTANLDIQHQLQIMELVGGLAQRGLTVCAAMHDLSLAARFCHSLALLHQGRVLANGPPREVLTPENIEVAFGVKSLVYRDPVTGSLAVKALSPSLGYEATGAGKAVVHVIGGGGRGARAMYALKEAGFKVTTGVLEEGDSDYHTARILGIPCPSHPSFTPISPALHQEHLDLVKQAHCVVLADVYFGDGNSLNLEAAAAADNLLLVEDHLFHERDYTGGRAARLYTKLRRRGTVTSNESLVNDVMGSLEASVAAKDSV